MVSAAYPELSGWSQNGLSRLLPPPPGALHQERSAALGGPRRPSDALGSTQRPSAALGGPHKGARGRENPNSDARVASNSNTGHGGALCCKMRCFVLFDVVFMWILQLVLYMFSYLFVLC